VDNELTPDKRVYPRLLSVGWFDAVVKKPNEQFKSHGLEPLL